MNYYKTLPQLHGSTLQLLSLEADEVLSKSDLVDSLEIVFYSTHLQTVHWRYHHDKVIRKEATASV